MAFKVNIGLGITANFVLCRSTAIFSAHVCTYNPSNIFAHARLV